MSRKRGRGPAPQRDDASRVGKGAMRETTTTAGTLAVPRAGEPSEAELLRRVRRGDRDALLQLLAAHRETLLAIAWSYLADREEALDACQEALARAVAHAGRFDPARPVGAWLARIVRNVCLDRLRRLRHRRHASLEERREAGLPDPGAASGNPERELLRGELGRALRAALAELRPEEREAIVMRDVLGWPYRRIEETLGLAHGTVASLIHRGRRRLRDRLRPWLATRPGAAGGSR